MGLLALVFLWVSEGGKVVQDFQKVGALLAPISSAYAQPVEALDGNVFTPKLYIMAGIFVVLGLGYIVGIIKLLFSENPDHVDAASDLVKTLTGFFVGAATGFLG